MGKLLDNVKEYFEITPREIIDKDFKEMAHLNEIGPDVMDYAESVRESAF